MEEEVKDAEALRKAKASERERMRKYEKFYRETHKKERSIYMKRYYAAKKAKKLQQSSGT